ncbi:hypothetical protein Acy02nite_25920 [Actinoplanes cyaneus]|uniref:DUF397 domain-containing protein n=1 Tax=Actinoplanes cyaneus TaxID=52696 RepID=A0A919IGE8_9ACTN|nr:hypothetical protein [Actinoplanes cyaneus]MCW2138079.1 Leucine rich repeat variant [Actinoplanes cyaneus]GID64711.1 hypothetical protein Acy02nite_25920 [Actinoplanes cyaneus]
MTDKKTYAETFDRNAVTWRTGTRTNGGGNCVEVTDRVATRLAADPSKTIRLAVAGRSDLPGTVLITLASDDDRNVREAVATNPRAPRETLLRLVSDPHRHVRWAVAHNPACDEHVQRAICASPDEDLRYQLIYRKDLAPDVAAALASDSSVNVRGEFAMETIDPAALATLSTDSVAKVRAGAAMNTRTTAEQRRVLAGDPSALVRSALVRTVTLEEEDLQRLVRDRSVEVRWWMAAALLTPPHIRDVLREDPDPSVRQQAEDPSY